MTKLITCLALAAAPILAWASCSTHTYFVNGKIVTCTTCCYSPGNCTTTCF